jgi:hypothetical protein
MKRGRFLQIGVYSGMSIETRRSVVFSNAVYWVVGILLLGSTLVQTSVLLSRGITPPLLSIPSLIIMVAAFCILLNHLHFHLSSRIFFMVAWVFLVIVFSVISKGPSPTTYFQHAYFSILFSPVVHLFFSHKTERLFLYFFLLVFLCSTLFSIDFLLAFDTSETPKVPLVNSTLGMRINHFVFFLFLNLLMIYVLRINDRLYQELEHKNDVIRNQNEELNQQRDILHDQNQELEKRVAERTQVLVAQNERLTEYAFMHSHVLRAPISRIRGLINLLVLTKDQDEDQKVRVMLSESMAELDDATRSINERLEGTGKVN